MNILQVLHSFLPYSAAGTEVYTYKLSKELSKKNKINIFFRVNDTKTKEYTVKHSRFDGLDSYAINHTFKLCGSFKDTYTDKIIDNNFSMLLDKLKPDIIHIHHLMFLSCGIASEAKKRGIPIIFTLHDYWLLCYRGQLIDNQLKICKDNSVSGCENCLKNLLKIKKYSLLFYFLLKRKKALFLLSIFKKLYFLIAKKQTTNGVSNFKESSKRICSEVDLFIAPSHFIKNKFIENGIPQEKIIYSPYGLDKLNFSYVPKKNTDDNILRFGYMGTLLPMKGLDVLISAFEEVKDKDIGLAIYGKLFPYTGFESYPGVLKRMIRSDFRIKLMGGYDNKDVGRILANIDVLVVPSIWLENAPLVIQEAFLARTPVIASRIGGIPELISDGINGLLFNPGDVNDLQEKMHYIINNPEKIDRFREKMPEVKSIEDDAKELEEIYNGLIRKEKAWLSKC